MRVPPLYNITHHIMFKFFFLEDFLKDIFSDSLVDVRTTDLARLEDLRDDSTSIPYATIKNLCQHHINCK